MTKKQYLKEILFKQANPVTAAFLIEKLRDAGIKINKTTVYREIYDMMKKGEIIEIDFGDGSKRYEMTNGRGHHHHLTCEKCDKTLHLPINEEDINREMEKNGFKVSRHLMEFFGICKECQNE